MWLIPYDDPESVVANAVIGMPSTPAGPYVIMAGALTSNYRVIVVSYQLRTMRSNRLIYRQQQVLCLATDKNDKPSTAKTSKVIVGMSGGVDSSIAAYLLQQQGYAVEGFYEKLG